MFVVRKHDNFKIRRYAEILLLKKGIEQGTLCQNKAVTKATKAVTKVTVPLFRKSSRNINLVMCRLSLYICQADNVCTE